MNETIIAALIGAAGVILAAFIGLFKKSGGKKTIVRQRAKGNDITQIGIQIEKREARGKHER